MASSLDSVNASLYFQAAGMAQAESVPSAKQKQKAEKPRKGSFASTFERVQAEHALVQDGFPPELAGMTVDEAVVFLKDEADIAGELLRKKQTADMFADYRKKVSRFLRYVEKHNFAVRDVRRRGAGFDFDPYKQIVVINQKLEQMAQWLLHDHRSTLRLLARIDEIKGLMVDLIAT